MFSIGEPVPDDPRGVAGDNSERGDILRDYAPRCDNCAVSNRDAPEYDRRRPDPNIASNNHAVERLWTAVPNPFAKGDRHAHLINAMVEPPYHLNATRNQREVANRAIYLN